MAEEGAAKRLFDGLLNIEVNTIVKAGMTGRKMPVVGQALLDIFSEYDTWLCECCGRLNPLWADFRLGVGLKAYRDELRRQKKRSSRIVTASGPIVGLPVTTLYDSSRLISSNEFRTLRDRAEAAVEMHRVMSGHGIAVEAGDGSMLYRIVRNCNQLVPILEKPGLAPESGMELSRKQRTGIESGPEATSFSADDVVTIRKAWELGVEVIVMQTVVQLDGDAVTRINEAHRSAAHQPLRDVHQQGVDTALGQWDSLVKTFLTIVREFTSFLGDLLPS